MTRLTQAALLAGFFARPASAAPETHAALAALQHEQPQARAVWRDGQPVLITGLEVATTGSSPAERAHAFLARRTELIAATLELADVDHRGDRAVVRFRQVHQGLPVVDHTLVVTLDHQGRVVRLLNDTARLTEVSPATIDAAEARRRAAERVLGAGVAPANLATEKVVFAHGGHGTEGYLVRVPRLPLGVVEVRVNATTGDIIGLRETVLR